MPGPGGGRNGGGGHGGGNSHSGGASHGGGRPMGGAPHGGPMGGPPHGGPMGGPPPRGRYHHRYRGFGYGPGLHYHGSVSSGCGLAILAVMFLIIAVVIIIPNIFFKDKYDEKTFQDYANAEYQKAFGESTAYEDNILITFLTTEAANEYYYIGWVGDHINADISNLFGNEYTELGSAMYNSISTAGYWYSLDTNLAEVVNTLTEEVENLNVESFTCSEDHNQVESKVINYTDFEVTEEVVNSALKNFTDKTNIPMVIVIEDSEEIFGK